MLQPLILSEKLRQKLRKLRHLHEELLLFVKVQSYSKAHLHQEEKLPHIAFEDFVWGWSCVMTRSVYLDVKLTFQDKRTFSIVSNNSILDHKAEVSPIDASFSKQFSQENDYQENMASWNHFQWKRNIWALVPFLDMFNHSPSTSVISTCYLTFRHKAIGIPSLFHSRFSQHNPGRKAIKFSFVMGTIPTSLYSLNMDF